MNFSARTLRSMLFVACTAATTFHCMAESASSNVESLINFNRWKEASRAIFMEAKSADKLEWSIPAAQAKAGFLDDALDTIAGMHPNMRSGAFLALVADVPAIPLKKSTEIVQQSLDSARKISGVSANYIKSGHLAKAALFYSEHGEESDARAVFAEALRAAASGANEEGSGGYRQVTEAMARQSKGNRDWMVQLVARSLQHKGEPANSAFAYRDLARVAVGLQKRELATELIEQGISAAKTINQASMQKLALEDFARVAVEAGYTKRMPEESPYTQAIQEARAGNLQKSLAIVSRLPQNLYVNHAQQAHKSVFDDAVKRDDLNTALYFTEHPVSPISWLQANAWRQVAELQLRRGAKKEAANSYLRAVEALSNSSESVRYLEEVKSMVILGTSMRQNGFEAEGRKATLDALAMIDRIPARRADDRIRASTLVSDGLWNYGMHSEAKQQILRAYRAASEYSDKSRMGSMEKARLLSELGQVTSTFIAKVTK